MTDRYYHTSHRALRIGNTLTVGVYGERLDSDTEAFEYAVYIREKLFEQYRQAHHPELPSRFDCVFLYPSEVSARAYHGVVEQYRSHLYEVELVSGTPFIADMTWLHCAGQPYEHILANAARYWSGEHLPDSVTLEAICSGEVRVRALVREGVG